MAADEQRSRETRTAAEAALVRVVHHYGSRPEFVVIGGLVPELLCADSAFRHAGTTVVDVQVDLDIACGAVNTRKLEHALRNAEFKPDAERVWRWTADTSTTKTIVNFELLAALDNHPAPSTIAFVECEQLGAANLRGTRFPDTRHRHPHIPSAHRRNRAYRRGQRHRPRRTRLMSKPGHPAGDGAVAQLQNPRQDETFCLPHLPAKSTSYENTRGRIGSNN